jgi:hypothetical protein
MPIPDNKDYGHLASPPLSSAKKSTSKKLADEPPQVAATRSTSAITVEMSRLKNMLQQNKTALVESREACARRRWEEEYDDKQELERLANLKELLRALGHSSRSRGTRSGES